MTDRHTEALLAQLIAQARTGRLSRRSFMEGALAAGLGVAGGSALWAGRVMAATPKKGGTFRFGCHDANTTDTLDPATTTGVYMIQLSHCARNYLTEIRADGTVGPDAATGWTASPDASEWRFELARDMTFHSGKAFTAADAVASLEYHRGETSQSAAKALLKDVTGIRADGDHALVITLGGGNADLPYLLTDYHFVMLPADASGRIAWESGDGAGPYRIVSHEPGVGTQLVRHDSYHRETWFDAVEFIALNDANARQSALLTGEVDALSETDSRTVNLLARNPRVKVVEVPSGTHPTIAMHVDTVPFDNPDLRLALKYAVNREELVDKILFGHGVVANDSPIAPGMPYYHAMPQRPYDPERARFHLKKAGMEGIRLSLSSSEAAFSSAVDLALLVRESAAACGMDITVVREPADGYWSEVWLKNPFMVGSWGQRPTPDVMFSLGYQAGAPWNETRWANPRFNALLLEARAELDDGKRAAMYAEMQELVHEDGGTVVPFFRNRVNAMGAHVGTPDRMSGNWEADGARSFQRWWFER